MPKKFARVVIFDGDCAFCQRSIRLGRRLDWLSRIEWLARLSPGVQDRFPSLKANETQNRMVSIQPDGRMHGGFYAVRDIALQLPLTCLFALLLYIPGVHWLGEPAYRWIAKNRHYLGGGPSESCSRP